MTVLEKLKLTSEKRVQQRATIEESLRGKLYDRLAEQKELVEAELAGKEFIKTRRVFVTNENGERVAQEVPRRIRKWFWHNGEGTWYVELRYGGKVMKIAGEKTAIEVGDLKQMPKVIATVMQAVQAGELDKALLAAKKERMATLRRNR
ncbi:DUF6641 family protein [Emcibacter sp.]|uniref:DUF6641 family protein n=1 Tax=Emcibacter sp. TaxID=1979954 RepID=UPI002AA78BA3|nr:DUF6641 family protein [Emcibacter sp.]